MLLSHSVCYCMLSCTDMKRPESAALSETDNNEVSKVDLVTMEENKPEDSTCIGKSYTDVVAATTLHFNAGRDDSEDDYTDLSVTMPSQSETGQVSLQVKPEVAVNQNLHQEKQESHFSSFSADDKIPLI